MTWPGTPKSQQSPPINQPSVRIIPPLTEHSSMAEVAGAIKTAFDGLTVHEQAFAALPAQVAAQAKAAATAAVENIESETTEGVTAFNGLTGAVIYFPNLGYVNDQLGEGEYTIEQTDNGQKIIVGDSSAVAINFDSGLTAPWFAIIDNDSSAVANLVAVYGQINGAQAIYPGGFGIVYFDGANWWAAATGGVTAEIVTAALTSMGSEGSMNFVDGLLVSQVPAT